ncbi:MAG: branched-chain amino acid ABC transporter permease [Methyloligellaceae bacterium]
MMKLTEIRKAERAKTLRSRTILWVSLAVVLLLIPSFLWGIEAVAGLKASFVITVMTSACIASVFALSYNMLLGQTGMLSFGHAIYLGLGGYFVMHMMNILAYGYVPVVIMPLLGGLFGLLFGVIFGSFSTRRAGTVFAMITLGLGELVGASSHVITSFFGGEDGIGAYRTRLLSLNFPMVDLKSFEFFWFEFNLAQEIQVYYFSAIWFFIATFLMFWYSRTPVGRMSNAVRDNEERTEFVGYNMRYVRYMSFIASAGFAGLAGGMMAVNLEHFTESVMNAVASGQVLLHAYIGGAIFFIGPIVGAFVITLLTDLTSGYTALSPLYLGLLFIAVVLFIPYGLTGIIVMHRKAWVTGKIVRLIPAYVLMLIPLSVAFVGFVGFVETEHFLHEAATGEVMTKVFFYEYNALPEYSFLPQWLSHWVPRLFFFGLVVIGAIGAYLCRGIVFATWESVNGAPEGSKKDSSKKSDQIGEKAAV